MSVSTALTRRMILLMPLAAAACRRGPDILELSGTTMGTRYALVAVDHDRKVDAPTVRAAVETALARVNRQLSNWDPNSEVSRFNTAQAGTAMPLSAEVHSVLAAAERIHGASDGAFDVTLGPLIETWGFGAQPGAARSPNADAIAASLAQTGQDKLRLGAASLSKTNSKTTVYTSGIGKGYGVDQVVEALAALGLTDFMVEIGGDLYAAGRNPDGLPWRIGIETPNPHDRAVQRVADVSGLGVATSGDYRNYFEQDGVRYSHILDPRTGRPVTHRTASATVLAPNAMLADGWSTAMLALGRERGLAVADRADLAVLFVERDTASQGGGFVATPSRRYQELQG
ncbi:MAG: FAD:protein FMN transferase [Pseudomonadota bacterium]